MTDFKIGDEVWFVCIDGDIWLLAKGTIQCFPLGNTSESNYPVAIIKNNKIKTEFHTSSYFKTKKEALELMESYVIHRNTKPYS